MSIFHQDEKEWSIPTSILVGSIIIALSICWSASKLAGGSFLKTADGALPQGDELIPGEKVTIEARRDAPKAGNGKIEIVEFTDFQCPFCQQFWNQAYKELKAKYIDTGKVTFVVRHFPLAQIHREAQKAAEAAECANRQGKFFEYHDILFSKMQSNGIGLGLADLKKYASDLGLNATQFNQCLDGGQVANIIATDLTVGQKAGVSGTPTFFINGRRLVGAQPIASFEAIIERIVNGEL